MSESRVFFALWPDAATVDAIDETTGTIDVDGRRVARGRLHLTLSFVGLAGERRIEQLRHQAAAIRVPIFTLRLDRIGYFSRPRIAWLGPSRMPEPLLNLARAVRMLSGASHCNTSFRPHITLARRAWPLPDRLRIAPVDWPVTHFSLVQSGTDGAPGAYSRRGEWPLI